jgi:CheY-like chemotaxis protein
MVKRIPRSSKLGPREPCAGRKRCQPSDTNPAEPAPALYGVRVVVVEDDDDCRLLFKLSLELAGASVVTAAGAREALRLVAETRPHVLVSDMTMPGEDGCWLLQHVRAAGDSAGRRLAAIVVTAHTSDSVRARCMAAGFDAFLAKPIDPDELCDAVARLACTSATS